MEFSKLFGVLFRRQYLIFIFFFVEVVCYSTVTCTSSSLPKLLLISFDGFRYDYLNRFTEEQVKHFYTFVNDGVKAEYMENVFPTVTYPNHFTLITGLYPESHGIVHNRFYDSHLNRHFYYDDISDNISPLWYDMGAESIYVTNQKAGNGRRSGSFVWPGGIGKVKCIGPDKVMPEFANAFANYTSHQRIDNIISWFNSTSDPINLGLLYFPEPDEIAHKYGPDSDEVNNYIKGELNEALGYLFDQLKQYNLYNSMNVILLADHGFTTRKKFVVLDDYINSSWYKVGSSQDGALTDHVTVNLFPEKGEENRILAGLQKATDLYIYKKGGRELKDLHYNDNDRIAPIVLTGQEGVVILRHKSEEPTFKTIGIHGYRPDIKNMRPFFMAMGPAFKKGYSAKPLKNVDVYELMCHILGITPAPNNGSFERVRDMLIDRPGGIMPRFTTTAVSFLIILGVSVTVAGVFSICALINARRAPRLLSASRGHHSLALGDGLPGSHHLLQSDDDDDDEF